ncbi:MAG: acyl-CoA thioesterase [Ideonella sp.]|nr:acyl-CoA thioesterase [Ideonella sp.]MCC7458768.1 acyl-CoA thioesterase [Nitrospira sp.]
MRFDPPPHRKLVYETVIPIRWGDMDAMGHINNTVYFRYMETARIDWCRSIGCMPEQSRQGPVIVNAWCNFLQQLRYPGDVRVKHHVTTVGRTSFDTYVTMERSDDPGVIWAEGGARMVWIDFASNQSLPLPQELREKIS